MKYFRGISILILLAAASAVEAEGQLIASGERMASLKMDGGPGRDRSSMAERGKGETRGWNGYWYTTAGATAGRGIVGPVMMPDGEKQFAIRLAPGLLREEAEVIVEPAGAGTLSIRLTDEAGREIRTLAAGHVDGRPLRLGLVPEGLEAGRYRVLVDDGVRTAMLSLLLVK